MKYLQLKWTAKLKKISAPERDLNTSVYYTDQRFTFILINIGGLIWYLFDRASLKQLI
jgi:hypothetical protein